VAGDVLPSKNAAWLVRLESGATHRLAAADIMVVAGQGVWVKDRAGKWTLHPWHRVQSIREAR
jgi:hypothetical protein